MPFARLPPSLLVRAASTAGPMLGVIAVLALMSLAVALLLLIEHYGVQAGRRRRERDLNTGAVNCGAGASPDESFQVIVRPGARPGRG